MDEPNVKRAKKSDKAKRNAELHGKYSQKSVRVKEALSEAKRSEAKQSEAKQKKKATK